jgi:outer membrane protein OmpA-like peptidoglycan-associated protein
MIKKLFTLCGIMCFMASHFVQAQSGAIGFHATMTEYDGDLSGNQHHFYDFKFNQVGAAISLQQYLNPSFNLVEKVSFNQVRYQNSAQTAGVDGDFYVLNLKLKYKFNNGYIFKEDAAIAPFLVAGVGGSYIDTKQYTSLSDAVITDGELKGNVAVGAGILFQFNDRFGLEVANTINAPLFDAWDGVDQGGNDLYLQHSAGLIFALRKPKDTDNDGVPDKKDNCPDTPSTAQVDSKGCPLDGDQDGVADYLDKCPALAGKTELEGCPDKDNDTVADQDDKCPDVPGIARFGGCPDTDSDGVEDAKDKCPNQAGLDIFEGCPDTDGDGVQDSIDKCAGTEKGVKVDDTGCPADTDGDTVPDNVDRCPTSKGDPANSGCPVVKEEVKKRLNFATRGITFETGKAVLKPSSYAVLDEIVSILAEYTDYNLKMGGHTDSNGSNATNLKLSQARVDAVKSYLTNKGADENRIEATGFGEETPIATNGTAAGRAQNRRVSLELVLKNP